MASDLIVERVHSVGQIYKGTPLRHDRLGGHQWSHTVEHGQGNKGSEPLEGMTAVHEPGLRIYITHNDFTFSVEDQIEQLPG